MKKTQRGQTQWKELPTEAAWGEQPKAPGHTAVWHCREGGAMGKDRALWELSPGWGSKCINCFLMFIPAPLTVSLYLEKQDLPVMLLNMSSLTAPLKCHVYWCHKQPALLQCNYTTPGQRSGIFKSRAPGSILSVIFEPPEYQTRLGHKLTETLQLCFCKTRFPNEDSVEPVRSKEKKSLHNSVMYKKTKPWTRAALVYGTLCNY